MSRETGEECSSEVATYVFFYFLYVINKRASGLPHGSFQESLNRMFYTVVLIFMFDVFAELQKAKEEEKQLNYVQVSFEKQLLYEKTLKIQVCTHEQL